MKTAIEPNDGAFACHCGQPEHQIVFRYNKEHKLVYCYLHLSTTTFWQRLKHGLRYIFGYSRRFGHWQEFIFQPEHADALEQLAETLRQSGPKKGIVEKVY